MPEDQRKAKDEKMHQARVLAGLEQDHHGSGPGEEHGHVKDGKAGGIGHNDDGKSKPLSQEKPLLGPDGKPVLGPDGKPIMVHYEMVLGPDGKPLLGKDGKPIYKRMEVALGPDGKPLLGPDGKPIFRPWVDNKELGKRKDEKPKGHHAGDMLNSTHFKGPDGEKIYSPQVMKLKHLG